MTSHDPKTAALDRLRQENIHAAVLDFDNTLYLDNSTERFLDALRPRCLAFMLALAGGWLAAARARLGWGVYAQQRDFMRVWLCAACMPWGWRRWRAAAARRMAEAVNHELLAAVRPHQKVIVLSFGFRPIIEPLLAALPMPATLLCSDLRWRADNLRAQGKIAALRTVLPAQEWASAIYLTDSEDDREMLETFPTSYLVQWQPYPQKAFHDLYLPLRYTTEGKYADSKYLLNQILMEDFPILLLAYAFSWPNLAALAALFLSLYAIYEIGLFHNDYHAAPRETAPRLSPKWREFTDYPIHKAWPWAIGCAALGLLCLHPPGTPAWPSFLGWNAARWAAILIALYAAFALFNRLPVPRRIWVFPALHTAKTFSFAALFPLTPLGIPLLLAQVLSQSVNYFIYRRGGNIQQFNRHAVRLVLFLIGIAAGGAACPTLWQEIARTQMLLIILWSMARALEHTRRMNFFRIAHRALCASLRTFRNPR